MPVLTHNEGVVIDVLRRQARQGDPVSASSIKRDALRHGVKYDGVDRALRGLLVMGLVEQPSRGWYLPASGKEQTP